MNTIRRSFAILLFLFISAFLSAQQGDCLYVLSDNGLELVILESDQIVKTLDLPFEIKKLYPTPGGGYLFLVGNQGRYIALNGLTRELEKTGQFPLDEIHWLTFSPTGHQLYVGGDEKVLLFDHSIGEPVNPRETSIPGEGAISFNRRGTRYYLTSNGSLDFRLLKDNSAIEQIRRTGNVFQWSPDPRFSSLWGVNESGELVIVDEGRGRVLKKLDDKYVREALVFHGNRSYLLAEEGREWVSVDQRRFRKEIHWEAPEKLSAVHKGKSHWYFTSVQSTDLWIWWGETPEEEQPSSIDLGFIARDSVWLALKQGEGFACF